MNKTAIRNFAVWARNKLIADVIYHAGLLGITKNGISKALSQSTKDVEFYDIGTAEPYAIRGEEILQRKSLVDAIRAKEKDSNYVTAYNSLMEEAAYTWFNRLIAVRFMEVNDYLPEHVRVLSSESGKQEPDIVTTPFDAELFFAEGEQQKIIQMKNDNKLDEVFRILFIKQCRELSRILPRLFEGTNDYTELLLSLSFIDQEGVVYHLVHDIPEDDFNVENGGQVEIIGWLYQYYNAELKDETFALLKNNVKVTKERIPSATQLFTPDWIVRYMVENSLGRLWIEGHPNDLLKSGWKYYLDEAEQEESVKQELEKIKAEYAKLCPEAIKVIDPCMGSGHILVYAFDILMQIYESAGYTEREAAKSILEHNLFGLDIDDRAAQLAYFAVMMKARQYNRRILDGETKCNVYAIKESNSFNREALVKLEDNFSGIAEKLLDAFLDAKEYGSIISVDVTLEELDSLDKRIEEVSRTPGYGNLLDVMYSDILCEDLYALIKQARIMMQKYHVVVTNPPYMGMGNMSGKLSNFLKVHYADEKSDLFSCFISRGIDMIEKSGLSCMVTMQSWMFLSTFEAFREKLLLNRSISNVLYMENMVMGIAFGTVVSIIRKNHIDGYKGRFNEVKLRDLICGIPKAFPVLENRNAVTTSDNFARLPGKPFAYWISESVYEDFAKKTLNDFYQPKAGLSTGDNERFLRLFWEVESFDLFTSGKNRNDLKEMNGKKWVPMTKGGDYRKWYGNNYYVLNFADDGAELKYWLVNNPNDPKTKSYSRYIRNYDLYLKSGLSFNDVTSGKTSFRYQPEGYIPNARGPFIYTDNLYVLGFLNTNVCDYFLNIITPTMSFNVGDVGKLPLIESKDEAEIERINELVKKSIKISRSDWDSFETSLDFKKHPLI